MISRLTLLTSSLFCFACGTTVGNSQPTSETRTVSPFTQLSANDGLEVGLTVDSAQSGDVTLLVTAEANLLPSVVTTVSNAMLGVGVDGPVQSHVPIAVTGTVSDISNAQADGGAAVVIEGVDRGTLTVGASGGASITAMGTADSLLVTSTGGAELDCAELLATTAEVSLDGGGAASVCVSGQVRGLVTNGATLTVLCGGDSSGVTTSNGGSIN